MEAGYKVGFEKALAGGECDCRLTSPTRIIPVLAILFLCSFLDRTNVGNARLYNLEADLGMTDHQYDIGLAVFYATYIIRFVAATVKHNET